MNQTPVTPASPARLAGRGRILSLLMRAVWIEALRRKDLWVVALLMGICILLGLAMRLVSGGSVEEARFVINLGMTVAFWLTAVLVAVFAARDLPAELENRTLYPLLAKPVGRAEVLFAKFLAVASVGIGLFLVFALVASRLAPWPDAFRWGLFGQTLALQVVALAMLAALALAGSVWWPAVLTLVVSLGLFFGGGFLGEVLKGQAPEAWQGLVGRLTLYVPNFANLDLTTRFTDGGAALAAGEFARLILYGLVMTGVFLLVAILGFRRKAL